MQLFFRYPGHRIKALTFSYDDGVYEDARLVDILAKHGMPGTFNLNAGWMGRRDVNRPVMTAKEAKNLYRPAGMEIAMHGYEHTWLERHCTPAMMQQILDDKKGLEEIAEEPVVGFAYPYGTYNKELVEILRLAGIKYARTVVNASSPYPHGISHDLPGPFRPFATPDEPLLLRPTCHHNDENLFEYAEKFLSLGENGKYPGRSPMSLFYVWGHSYEFADRDNWDRIEQFADKMAGHADIWYATNRDIIRYHEAVERAEVSADGGYVYNPTACTLHFLAGGQAYTAAPGETVTIQK